MFTSNHSDELEVVTRRLELGSLGSVNSQGPPHWNAAIETLSDDVLLENFDSCLVKNEEKEINPWREPDVDGSDPYDAWYTLAHVCQRWRYVVLAPPRRLNLRLHCSKRRDSRNFPLDEDNIIAVLEHPDRVCEIKFKRLTSLQAEKLVPFMQKPFPALTNLHLEIDIKLLASDDIPDLPFLPDSFLGGSAPHLRSLCLSSMEFPSFPKFLLCTSNLVHLNLEATPSGYFSPELVAALSALSKLEVMHICFFESDDSDSDSEVPAPPPLIRTVLPTLKILELDGDGDYLDDFAGRIDVPSIKYLEVVTPHRFIEFHDFSHLPQFIGRVETFLAFDFARFHLSPSDMDVTLTSSRRTRGSRPRMLRLKFSCDTDDTLPSLVEACNTSLIPLSNIEKVDISSWISDWDSQSDGFNTTQWLEIIRHFSAAKSLYLRSMCFVPPVAFALKQAIEEGITGVLPAIQKLTVCGSLSAGPVREAIEQFVTARGLSVSSKTASWVAVAD